MSCCSFVSLKPENGWTIWLILVLEYPWKSIEGLNGAKKCKENTKKKILPNKPFLSVKIAIHIVFKNW